MHKYIVMGPQGCGKGTQAKMLEKDFDLVHISKDEQMRRFKERQKTEFKQYKITDEDWRNRKQWDAYEAAICDMLDRTSTEIAPWTLVESENKYYGRIKILRTLVERLEGEL